MTANPPLVCGTCTACCHTPPFLDDGETSPHPVIEDFNLMQQVWQKRFFRRPDGKCMFLDEIDRCSIYSSRPAVCRRFDCRDWYRQHTRGQRRAHNKAEQAVFAAAKERGA